MSDDHDPIVYCEGVSSVVTDGPETIGHVTLLDCDVTSELSIHQLSARLDRFTAVFRSSTKSFHLWILQVRPFEQTILEALELRSVDLEHIRQSKLRESWVLRTGPKMREGGEIYKSPPELVSISTEPDREISRAHYELLRRFGERDAVPVPELPDGCLVGDGSITTHRYMSIDDSAKGEVRK